MSVGVWENTCSVTTVPEGTPVASMSTLTGVFLLIVTSGKTKEPALFAGTGIPSIAVTLIVLAGLREP
jgi:hypothetical protein